MNKQFWPTMLAACVPIILVTAIIVLTVHYGVDLLTLVEALITVILALLAGVVLAAIINGKINLALLISEDNGVASLSRFQFLVFTFVIAGSYFVLLVTFIQHLGTDLTTYKLPEIPPGVLGLIGLSGGSYVISKGIQKSAEGDQGNVVKSIAVLDHGGGYTPNSKIKITISGGGGSDAAGIANIDANGTVGDITVAAQGSGYTSAPDVSIPPPLAGAAGARQATAHAIIA
jgi:hypothetical protein